MIPISPAFVEEHLSPKLVVSVLKQAFSVNEPPPQRSHHEFHSSNKSPVQLLGMPAWNAEGFCGYKLITVRPENAQKDQASIQGVYILFDQDSSKPVMQLDAKLLTHIRTAAASALASSYLSRKDSSRLLMIGTGALIPFLIEAHAAMRPIQEVAIWGRDFQKAKAICDKLKMKEFEVVPLEKFPNNLASFDIISSAVPTEKPLIRFSFLPKGIHIDAVGGFRTNMREVDDETIQNASIYADHTESVMMEAGDIFNPLQQELITKSDIKGDLFFLCKKDKYLRIDEKEITYFKSVGNSLEDLAVAVFLYKKYNQLYHEQDQ